MNAKIAAIQTVLGVTPDGIWGPKSEEAFNLAIHPEKARWSWLNVEEDGDDLVIGPGVVTAFGGASDSMDSGETASGISTKQHPDYIGCALPMRRDSSSVLRGSPIPKIPWFTKVIFSDGDKNVETELIDEGPAEWTHHCGDLTVAAARRFVPSATANNFEKTLTIRVPGGAKYLHS